MSKNEKAKERARQFREKISQANQGENPSQEIRKAVEELLQEIPGLGEKKVAQVKETPVVDKRKLPKGVQTAMDNIATHSAKKK